MTLINISLYVCLKVWFVCIFFSPFSPISALHIDFSRFCLCEIAASIYLSLFYRMIKRNWILNMTLICFRLFLAVWMDLAINCFLHCWIMPFLKILPIYFDWKSLFSSSLLLVANIFGTMTFQTVHILFFSFEEQFQQWHNESFLSFENEIQWYYKQCLPWHKLWKAFRKWWSTSTFFFRSPTFWWIWMIFKINLKQSIPFESFRFWWW